MKKLALAAAAASVLFTGAASAADIPVPAPTYTKAPVLPEPLVTWGGFYVGINGGGAWGRTNTTLITTNDPTNPFFNLANIPGVNAAGTNRINTSGGVAGGQIGYLWQNGRAILGIEAAFDWTNLNGSVTNTQPFIAEDNFNFTIFQNPRSDWLFTFLGRVGYDMGAWYPYITGGLAVADLKYGFNYIDPTFAPGCTACAASFSQTKLGGAIGGGVAWRVANNWTLRGEYLFISFDDLKGSSSFTANGTGATFAHTAKFNESVARVSLDYSFGGPVVAKY